MSNDFLNELLALHPDLAEEYNSEQYQLSLEIIRLMTELGEDSKKMAKIIGCNHKKYLRLESGDISIPVAEYKEIISKIKLFKELSATHDEQSADYDGFSFNTSKTLVVSTLENTAILETVKQYLTTKRAYSTEKAPVPIKSYIGLSRGLVSRKVSQKVWFKLSDNNMGESSNLYQNNIYHY